MPLLSVVTISFNQRPFLEAAVRSVVEQKKDFAELIVVDAGSTDGSRELLCRYRSEIEHLLAEPDDGPADGLNKGFARASGKFGYFLNADDYLLPGGLERLRRLWMAHRDVELLLCRSYMVDREGRPLRELVPTPVSLAGLAYGTTTIVQQGMSFDMALFRRVGGFNTDNRTCWDYELLCELLMQGARALRVPARVGAFRLHPAGLSGGSEGGLHAKRYEADLNRIFLRLYGRAPGKMDRWRGGAAPVIKALRSPSSFGLLCRDKLLPGLLCQQYARDLAGNR